MAGVFIRETELREFLTQEQEIRVKEMELKALKEKHEQLELNLIEKVEAGAPTTGKLMAKIIVEKKQTKPAWKTIATRYGEQLAYSTLKIMQDAREEAEERAAKAEGVAKLVILPKEQENAA